MPFTGSATTWSDPEPITAMPNWVDRCVTSVDLTSGWTDNFFTVSNVGDRFRVTSTSPSGNFNLRRAYGMAHGGVMADSEARVSLYAASDAAWHDTGKFQWGTCHRLTTRKQVLDTGVVTTTGTSSTAVGDTTKAWTVHGFVSLAASLRECFIAITNGTGSREPRRILDNSATAITTNAAAGTTPVNGDRYEVFTYVNKCIFVGNTVALSSHSLFQATYFDSASFGSNPTPRTNTDVNGFLGLGAVAFTTFPTWKALPWHMKSRIIGSTIECVVWMGTEAEPDYGTAAQWASWTVPVGFEDAGYSGVYAGHLDNGDYMTFDNIRVRPL